MEIKLILPNKLLIPEGDILLVCEFGLSKAFDIDNAVKPFQVTSYILNLLTSYILNFLSSYRQSSKLLVNY
jgi:hypothetical protein